MLILTSRGTGALRIPYNGDFLFYLVISSLCQYVLSQTDGGGYSLSTPHIYVAYSGDLEVAYTIPKSVSLPNAYIQLVFLGVREKEVTTLAMPLGYSSIVKRIACGVVEYAGRFSFRMFMQHGGRKLAEVMFEVRWPTISLSVPLNLVAQTYNVKVYMRSEAKCDALIHEYSFWMELQYVGGDRDSAQRDMVKPFTLARTNVSAINSPAMQAEFLCNSVDLAGFYRVVFKSSFNSSIIIAKSNLIFSTWSANYSISTNTDVQSIFPCVNSLTLFYEQPLCPGAQDKIRIYKQVRNVQGSVAAPVEPEYVFERFAVKGRRTLRLDCELFESETLGYCFIYVSLSNMGTVTEQKKYCLPTHEHADLIADGQWSSWSRWGQCSVTCEKGKKSRFRMCDDPPPLNGGKFCPGHPVEWTACSSVCPEVLSELNPLSSIKLEEGCACGCKMTEGTGKVVGTGRCLGLSVWNIRVRSDQRIKLSFVYMEFYQKMQWVQVRNGGTRDAEMLAVSDGSEPLGDVFSTSNEIMIEFMTKSTTTPSTIALVLLEPTESIHVHGFIAYYNVLNNNVSSAAPSLTPITKPAWQNVVTIGGVIVCVIVIVGTIVFTIYHRIQRRRLPKYKMANPESPSSASSPVHNKGTSVQSPSSPDELESPGVDMETPLTGELKRKNFHTNSGKTRGSLSSTSSAGYKRLRAKAVIETKPSSRSHTPLQSPYAANASMSDFKHDQNFFKGYRPKSPKVHPSPKSRRASLKSPSSPTKHSILTKALVERRKDEGSDRVVIGASSTPTSKENSGSASTAKTDDSGRTKRGKTQGKETVKNTDHKVRDKHSDDPHNILKSNKKRVKSSGVCTPINNSVEMEVRSVTSPGESSAKHFTTEFSNANPKARRPTSLTDCYESDKTHTKHSPKGNKKYKFMKKREAPKKGASVSGTMEERQKCLPKPDGQSPENIREDRRTASLTSTPKSIKSLRSNMTLSPTKSVRSANTPSDMAELEYDDFIEDDPLSYFEYDEMLKLRWHGVEKIGKPIKEEESSSVNVNGVEKR